LIAAVCCWWRLGKRNRDGEYWYCQSHCESRSLQREWQSIIYDLQWPDRKQFHQFKHPRRWCADPCTTRSKRGRRLLTRACIDKIRAELAWGSMINTVDGKGSISRYADHGRDHTY